jgi:hypothetical protein
MLSSFFKCVLPLGILGEVVCRVLLVVVLQGRICLILVQLLELFFFIEDWKEIREKAPDIDFSSCGLY